MQSEDKPTIRIKKMGLASAGVGIAGLFLFTGLLCLSLISEASYIILVSVTALLCVVLLTIPRLKELNLKDLTLKLQKLEAIEESIYAKSENLKTMTETVAILVTDAVTHKWARPIGMFNSVSGLPHSVVFDREQTKLHARDALLSVLQKNQSEDRVQEDVGTEITRNVTRNIKGAFHLWLHAVFEDSIVHDDDHPFWTGVENREEARTAVHSILKDRATADVWDRTGLEQDLKDRRIQSDGFADLIEEFDEFMLRNSLT